jgi:hypothetical protein
MAAVGGGESVESVVWGGEVGTGRVLKYESDELVHGRTP